MQPANDLTGNDYVCIPFIGPDGSMDGVNLLHAGTGSLLEWSGPSPERPLFRLRVSVDGASASLAEARWRRLDRWIPAFTMTLADGCTLSGTICAPGGYPGTRGFFVRLEIENRTRRPIEAVVELDVCWAHTTQVIASRRPFGDDNSIWVDGRTGALVLGTDRGRGPSLAVTASESMDVTQERAQVSNGTAVVRTVRSDISIVSQRRGHVSFYIGAGRECDGAVQTAVSMRRTGSDALLRQGRLELSHTLRPAQDHRWAELLNRNLIFARYFACGRAIDDDRLYFLRSRSPSCPSPALANEREALFWTLPALSIADPGLAREALMRALELFSERSGEYRRYIDGGAFDAAFALDQFLLYAWAVERYVRDTEDDSVLQEPLVQQVLHETDTAAFLRLHPEQMLGATEVLPSGDASDHPYGTVSNVLLWWFCEHLPKLQTRTPEDPPAHFDNAAPEVAAAIWQHCVADVNGRTILASTSDLAGQVAIYDDPSFSLALLPFLGFCPPEDPVWRDTMDFLRSSAYPLWHNGAVAGVAERGDPTHARLAALCADMLVLDRAGALERLQRLDLPAGLAAAAYDAEGKTSEPYHAALAGFLAWTLVTAAEPQRENDARRKRRR